jgi:hypothetical protein
MWHFGALVFFFLCSFFLCFFFLCFFFLSLFVFLSVSFCLRRVCLGFGSVHRRLYTVGPSFAEGAQFNVRDRKFLCFGLGRYVFLVFFYRDMID